MRSAQISAAIGTSSAVRQAMMTSSEMAHVGSVPSVVAEARAGMSPSTLRIDWSLGRSSVMTMSTAVRFPATFVWALLAERGSSLPTSVRARFVGLMQAVTGRPVV
jgi:hypothetical protein